MDIQRDRAGPSDAESDGDDRFLVDLTDGPGARPHLNTSSPSEPPGSPLDPLSGLRAPSGRLLRPAATRDTAVSEVMALIVASQAPLPVSARELQRTETNAAARADYRAVCAIVPSLPENRVLVFFHGNNDYVTVDPRGDLPREFDPGGHSRLPRWLSPAQRTVAATRPAAAIRHGLHRLGAGQRRLLEAPLADLPIRAPIVLLPETVERTDGPCWGVPPRGQYGAPGAGVGPRPRRLDGLIEECQERLRALARPGGGSYLPASVPASAGRRYLAGHGGGGKPLMEAAGADLAPSGGGVDLWLLDCTFRASAMRGYLSFAHAWHERRRLAHRPEGARLVCVYRPLSAGADSETTANELRSALARLLGVPPADLRKLHDSADMSSASMIRDVIPALRASPVLFIRTHVAHEVIPTLFTPLLLRTAAS